MNIINLEDKKYPRLLKKVGGDAPKQLYYKGNWPFDTAQGKDDIFKNCLAVVGSRRMTTYGKQVVDKIVAEVAAAGITVVSGFMYGVDAASHKAALKVGGRTIAVMPCGIDLIHPEYQQDLYVEILNNQGLVVSEYGEKTQPSNWTYPRRNRIVAGLSRAALIVEAAEKSGSLITAHFAKKFKRKVFVIPGPITSENSKGIMQLIKEGATPVGSAKDILDYYKIKPQIANQKLQINSNNQKPKDNLEREIIEKLKTESLEIDVLARNFNIPISKIGVTLSMMQLKGLIYYDGYKYHFN